MAITPSPAFLARLREPELDALARRWTVRSYRHNEAIIAHRDSGRVDVPAHLYFWQVPVSLEQCPYDFRRGRSREAPDTGER